ncbi:efflux RND transporter permease subunit [Novosphingobium sp.]|uniref:efflux RND transporter permease subunit n=1 Tax=Novosphingobium sp. TaxID=1874826 RepID=UPI0031D5BB99
MKISAWAIRHPIPVAVIMIALTLAGIWSYLLLPIKRFPNVEFPVVSVSVTQQGAAPSEMEQQITRPIEDALTGIAGLRHTSSTVTLGASSTSAEFEIGTDMQKAVEDVRTAVERTRATLPQGIDAPSVTRVDMSSAPILTYAVSAPGVSAVDLSWFVDDTVARALQAQRGVAQVKRIGGVSREINITLDPDRMTAHGVTAYAINTALAQFHRDDTGGRSEAGGREQTIRVLGSSATMEQLRNLTIPLSATQYVRLGDLATITDSHAEERGFARLDGHPAIAFQVSKTTAASDVSVEDGVDRAIATLNGQNKGIAISKVVSTVSDTRASYLATVHVLIEGMVLAALVVFLFLRDWRATVIAALAMPLSLVPTFGAMVIFGFSLNVITLLGLTLVIGILVDDAIVEIENIQKRIEGGASPYRASLIGADAIGLAVVATTATIIVVFAPVSFMGGQSGQFFREFGLTVAVAVLFSLLVARFVTPLMAAYFLKPSTHSTPPHQLRGAYPKVLDWALARPKTTVGIGILVFVGALGIAATLPVGFQPTGDPGYFYLSMQGTAGSNHETMDRAVRDVTARLRKLPDVERVFAQVGSTSSGGGPGGGGGSSDLQTGTLSIVLKHDRSMTTDEFQRSITGLLRQVPEVRLNNQGGFGAAGVEVVLAGRDGDALARAQSALLRDMQGMKTTLDPRPAPPPSAPELIIRPLPDAAARLNVSSQAIAQVARIATIGDIDANVAKFPTIQQRLSIRVRLPRDARADLDQIGNLQVPTLDGKMTPLRTVAELSIASGPGQIQRYDRERRVSVQADLNGTTIGQALNEVATLPAMHHLPAGVHEARTGDSEALADLFGGIVGAMASGILMIYFVLVMLFHSFFKPVTILSALPLTMLGAFVALKVTGIAITLPVLIGMLMLLGLAAKNSILLVEFAIEDERAGQPQREAIMNACRERARPIVMTTVAMAAGMLPTALGIGEGSTFRQPMAIAVIGGLISSTMLSLVMVPVVYELIDNLEMRLRPRLAKFITPRAPGDDDPVLPEQVTLVSPTPDAL